MNERVVLDHVTMVASDLVASQRFYDAALAPLGIGRVFDFTDATGYGGPMASRTSGSSPVIPSLPAPTSPS